MAKEQTNQPGELGLDEQLKALEIEERRQALESRKIHDELARLQLTDLRQQVETKKNNKERGKKEAEQAIADRAAVQARCNHHTGGKGAEAVHWGQGDMDRPTCIGAQVFLDDRIRLVCGRCSKEWFSDMPDRQEWARAVDLWKHSINTEMMVIGGLKVTKQPHIVA